MAALLGLKDRTMISKYERGHVLPSFAVASKFEIIFDVNMPHIFPTLHSRWRREVDHVKEGTLKTKFKHYDLQL